MAAILAAGLATPALAEPAPGQKFPRWDGPKPQVDCTCRQPGGARVSLGAVVCLRYGGEFVTARCEMPQNMPFWRILGDSCAPVAQSGQSLASLEGSAGL